MKFSKGTAQRLEHPYNFRLAPPHELLWEVGPGVPAEPANVLPAAPNLLGDAPLPAAPPYRGRDAAPEAPPEPLKKDGTDGGRSAGHSG